MFKLLSWALLIATCFFAAYAARAAEIHPPAGVIAGTAFTIPTAGAGKATFYLVGPTYTGKREVQLGQAIEVNAEEVRSAGQYTVVLRSSDGEASANFYVTANQPAALSFLAHPSRIPAVTSKNQPAKLAGGLSTRIVSCAPSEVESWPGIFCFVSPSVIELVPSRIGVEIEPFPIDG